MNAPEEFIRKRTTLAPCAFVPEILLYSGEGMEALWKELQTSSGDPELPPPFWAFPWAGGLGLARFVLDHPEYVKGKRVLDFASGSGIVGLAAAKAGAKSVTCCDIDPFALEAIRLNASENNLVISLSSGIDFQTVPKGFDLILAGDVCYEHLMAHRSVAWLRRCVEAGLEAIIGDPGRAYTPQEGVTPLAHQTVPTSLELEDRMNRDVSILRLHC